MMFVTESSSWEMRKGRPAPRQLMPLAARKLGQEQAEGMSEVQRTRPN